MSLLEWLIYAQIPAFLAVVIALFVRRIARFYRWFIVYLFCEIILTLAAGLVRRYGTEADYFYYYFASVPILWLAVIRAALEAYLRVMKNHTGLARMGSKVIGYSVLLGILFSIWTLALRVAGNASHLFEVLSSIERFVLTGILIFWLLVIAFIVWFPVSLSRNTVFHCLIFAAHFIATAAVTLVQTVTTQFFWLSAALMIAGLCLALAWTMALTRAGETQMVRIGHRWNPSDEKRLLEQLDAINDHLMKSSRVP